MAEIVALRVLQHDSADTTVAGTTPGLTGSYYKNNGETRMVIATGATGTTCTIKGVLDPNRRIADTVIVIPANTVVYVAAMPPLLYGQQVNMEFTSVATVKVTCLIDE